MNEEYTYSESERGFKGIWIPAPVWLDDRLTALDKFILAEIDSLDDGEGGCYATNEYLASFCRCSERKVKESISKLKKCGYIKYKSFDGRRRVLISILTPRKFKTEQADRQKMPGGGAESARLGGKKCPQSNIDNNIASNNKRNIYKEKAAEIIAYLNEKISASYKPTTQATLSAISARLNEGFGVDDFKLVIDRKAEDWLNDSRMSKFLRPQTLFSPKFEGYLQEAKRKKKDESMWGEVI